MFVNLLWFHWPFSEGLRFVVLVNGSCKLLRFIIILYFGADFFLFVGFVRRFCLLFGLFGRVCFFVFEWI